MLDMLNNFMEQKLKNIASLVADKKRLDARIEGIKEQTEKERTQLKELDQKNTVLSGEMMRTEAKSEKLRGQLMELADQLKGVHSTIEQKSQEYFGELRVLDVEKSTCSERVQD